MIKKVWLWLTCLVLLLSFLGCKLPTSSEVGVPVISYFRAIPLQIPVGENSILSWDVHVAGFAAHHTLRVTIHSEISPPEDIEVARAGTIVVQPEMTTVYTLTADVGGNSVSKTVTVFVGL